MPPTARLVLLLYLTLTACAGASRVPAEPPTPMPRTEELPYLAAAFEDGASLPAGDMTVTARTLEIGTLSVPDGQVVVADAFAGAGTEPLSLRVTPGDYPVVLSLITYPTSQYETVAAAMLRLAEGKPVTWRLATRPGQDTSRLAEDEFLGYPVDSGTALFASPQGARLFGERVVRFGAVDMSYITEVSEAMQANAPNGGSWANLLLDEQVGTNAVLFESGYGDGVYAAYWGYDAAGTLVCLATDFDLLF